MIVYRLCDEKEINTILNEESFSNVGNSFFTYRKINTHRYQEDKKYLHFFRDYDSLFYFLVTKRRFICTYDIPDVILNKGKGIGYYFDRVKFKTKDIVSEYAVMNEDISFDYLVKIDKVNGYIDFEDYVENNYQDKLETIYLKDKQKVLKK